MLFNYHSLYGFEKKFYLYHCFHIFLTIKLKEVSSYLWNSKLYFFFLEFKMVFVTIFSPFKRLSLLNWIILFFLNQCFLKMDYMPGQSPSLFHLILINLTRKLRLWESGQSHPTNDYSCILEEDRYKSDKNKSKTPSKKKENMSLLEKVCWCRRVTEVPQQVGRPLWGGDTNTKPGMIRSSWVL